MYISHVGHLCKNRDICISHSKLATLATHGGRTCSRFMSLLQAGLVNKNQFGQLKQTFGQYIGVSISPLTAKVAKTTANPASRKLSAYS